METHQSPPWSRTTKLIVALVGLALIVLIGYRFRGLLEQIIAASILAYILNPLISVISRRTPISRGVALLLVYLILLVLLIGAVVAVGFAAYVQGVNLIEEAPDFIAQLLELISEYTSDTERVITVLGYEFSIGAIDVNALQEQALALVEPAISQSTRYASQIAGSTLRFIGQFAFVFIISAYIANEIPQLRSYVNRLAYPSGYQEDTERLMFEFGRIWSAYLRGQVILGLIIGTAAGASLGILGVQNALALGILAGLLEFIPNLGPLIATAAAMLVAFFQPDNYLGLSSVQLTLAVVLVMIIIQQVENNVLVPRIVGEALDLHPILVIIGVLAGASLAGILGAILAAPLLASFKLVGIYAWRKLFDLPPFPPLEEREPALSLRQRLAGLFQSRDEADASEPGPDNP